MIGALVIGAALLNVALNFWLIPLAGAMGAALATVGAYGALAGLAYLRAERDMPMAYPWGTFAKVVGLILVLYAVGDRVGAWETPYRLSARIGLILAYLPAVAVVGLYSCEESRAGWRALRRRLGRDGNAADGT